ncbi:hypothetical protein VC83_02645 [Pseudogymnoascus destructans]|uniref:CENP-V/GFA domain-containing protein n=1 Tax=Pseudogymnoascus destructans TaxID=655981 RepID=A0A177AIP7_9PEZI|nr:uncharacterized protein VC83_02645 [Pseudogymnoascus destructans]OAF61133.1 hypothetical protein VC83_02645 [Pseudogymnoascus destructans]
MDFRISAGVTFFRSGRRTPSSWLLLGDEAAYDSQDLYGHAISVGSTFIRSGYWLIVQNIQNIQLINDGVLKHLGTKNEAKCTSERSFCSNCSTMLWNYDAEWPELIHPFASAIDKELPVPEEMVCILEGSKPEWVRWPEGKKVVVKQYHLSLENWHREKGLYV